MEEQIQRTVSLLKRQLFIFWLVPVMFTLASELDAGWVGLYASQVQAVYVAETLSILLAALCVPLSLKLFARQLTHQIDQASLPQALRLYVRWSAIRLVLLEMPVMVGFFTYYGLLSSKGLLCALIALTASLFCLPGEQRLRRELQIEQE